MDKGSQFHIQKYLEICGLSLGTWSSGRGGALVGYNAKQPTFQRRSGINMLNWSIDNILKALYAVRTLEINCHSGKSPASTWRLAHWPNLGVSQPEKLVEITGFILTGMKQNQNEVWEVEKAEFEIRWWRKVSWGKSDVQAMGSRKRENRETVNANLFFFFFSSAWL